MEGIKADDRHYLVLTEFIPRLSHLIDYCPKEHAKHRKPFRARDGTVEFAGIKLVFCEACQRFYPMRARPWAPLPGSIVDYAPLIRRCLDKLRWEEEWPHILEYIRAKGKTELIHAVQNLAEQELGRRPDFRTVEKVLDFCEEAGKKLGFTVDGVVRRINGYVLIPDPFGIDPPFALCSFLCPIHGEEYDLNGLVEGQEFTLPCCDSVCYVYGVDIEGPFVKCCARRVPMRIEGGRCPLCGTCYKWSRDYRRLRKLEPSEAFHYDFEEGWVWYWKLKCEHCGDELDLGTGAGSWYCPSCASYRRPQHSYKWFRCTLPCGHDGRFSIWYVVDNLPLRCSSCGHEVRLPDHVRLAWSEAEYTLLDVPTRVAVNNPLLAIAGLVAFFGLLGFVTGSILAKGLRDG